MTHKIVMTGGGTAGHVTPNLALMSQLTSLGWDIEYIGSQNGVEKKIISALQIPYHMVSTGKLRRYFSWRTVFEPFKIIQGIWQAYRIIQQIKPQVIFSKGGFVAFPVVVGAWLNRIPVIAHESDMSPGLANKLSYPFVNRICLTFDASKKYFKEQSRIQVTGTPIRPALFQGNPQQGLLRCGFNLNKPCLLVIGGSQGSKIINDCVIKALDRLTEGFQVIHICGQGNLNKALVNHPGYFQLEYADEELPDLLAASQIVISRSGANTLYELLALNKPHILIPLSTKASRGDQIQNAEYFEKKGASLVIQEERLSERVLLEKVLEAHQRLNELENTIKALNIQSATPIIVDLIQSVIKI